MRERGRRYALPALLAAALFAVAAITGYVTDGGGFDRLPEEEIAQSSGGTRGAVQSLSGNTLVLITEAGPQQFTLTAGVSIEALKPAPASSITVGEWLNVGAISHVQTTFVIVGLTLIPQALLQDQ